MSASAPKPPAARARRRGKVTAGALALLLGWAGAQRWYLGARSAPWISALAALLLSTSQTLFASRWENPAFLALFVLAAAGFIDGLRICLMPDEAFDARYNPGLPAQAMMGWPVVCLAVATLFIGAAVTLLGITMANLYIWRVMGWLDGYAL